MHIKLPVDFNQHMKQNAQVTNLKGWGYNTFIDYKLISLPTTSNGVSNKAWFGRSSTMSDEDR